MIHRFTESIFSLFYLCIDVIYSIILNRLSFLNIFPNLFCLVLIIKCDSLFLISLSFGPVLPARIFRARMWLQLENNISISEIREVERTNATDTMVSQPKYEFLLANQINRYLARKDRKYDFLDLGETEEFTIL